MNKTALGTADRLWDLSREASAVYRCPKVNGARKGPLVPYAGKDQSGRNYVGDIYFNFRRIEPHLAIVNAFAERIKRCLEIDERLDQFGTVCGIPNGGRTLGQELARITGKRFVYADKKPKPVEPGKKQEYEWDLSQFSFAPFERLAIVEDVFNNLQNTNNTLTEIAKTGATPIFLCGALNRSPMWTESYPAEIRRDSQLIRQDIPIVAAIQEPYPEYRQDDPEVAADVAAGNVEWEVKKNWPRLMDAMDAWKR